MIRIKKLDKDTISKIAAGEVVAQPSSVVKELMENSADAKASDIRIFLTDGGIKEVTVVDNGNGMSKEDLYECFRPHTTSKITTIADLESVESFGFRGEALSSIASVSRMHISSRESDKLEGYYIELEGGEVVSSGMVGMPIGTKVTVGELFYNVPARKKYLKSPAEELRAVSTVVSRMCLAYPNISFRFYHNGMELLNIPSDPDHDSRVKGLFSERYFQSLIPVTGEDSSVTLHGYVSHPQEARTAKFKQHLFINNRQVRDNMIADAVKTAYGTLIDGRKYPQFILFLQVPSNLVDVNIHPKKETVMFLDKARVYSIIKKAVADSLESHDLTHEKSPFKRIKDVVDTFEYPELSTMLTVHEPSQADASILQVHDLYLIKETDKGILVVDQHAAHERILYEKMLAGLESRLDEYYSVELAIPQVLDIDLEDKMLLEENLEILRNLGFSIDGDAVTHVPAFMEGRNILGILKEFLDSLNSFDGIGDLDSQTQRALSHLACKLAVKDGQKLNPQERDVLLVELEKSEIPYVCPHGRTAKIYITLDEMAGWFDRK